jgi:hypothetical protein
LSYCSIAQTVMENWVREIRNGLRCNWNDSPLL